MRSVSALGPSWAILGHMGRSGAILGYLGQMTHLGPCWPIPLILDPSCSILSPSWFLSGAPSVNSFFDVNCVGAVVKRVLSRHRRGESYLGV